MKIDTIDDPDFCLMPASRSSHFLGTTVLLGSDILMIAILLVKKLASRSLPLTTAIALVVAMYLLVECWRTFHRQHERIVLLLKSREEFPSNPTVLPLLRASADFIHRGLFLTAMATLMLLLGFGALLRGA